MLASAQMPVRIHAAGKGKVVDGSAPPFQPSEQTAPRVCSDFKLHGSSGLLLNHHGPGADHRAGYKGANLDFHEITTPQLAVDRKVEKRSITHPTFAIKKESDGPNLANLESALSANLPASIPCRPSYSSRIIL